MGVICGGGIGGSTHELVRDDHVFCVFFFFFGGGGSSQHASNSL